MPISTPLPYSMYQQQGSVATACMAPATITLVEAAEQLGKPLNELNIINCHLGNGGGLRHQEWAIRGYLMGMTPLEGLVMGTRCGDIDPAIIFF